MPELRHINFLVSPKARGFAVPMKHCTSSIVVIIKPIVSGVEKLTIIIKTSAFLETDW